MACSCSAAELAAELAALPGALVREAMDVDTYYHSILCGQAADKQAKFRDVFSWWV